MLCKKSRIKPLIIILVVLIVIAAIVLLLLNLLRFGYAREVPQKEAELREQYIHTANQWMGANWNNGSHKPIIDLYNGHSPLPQGYKVSYTDKWCATFVSAIAIQREFTSVIPKECGCERQIELFRQIDRWEENDAYIPLPGDIIYYSSEDSGAGDCQTWSDHVGIVVGTRGNYIKVIEGNVGGTVAYRYMKVDAITIRGYGLPDYAAMLNKTPMD